MIEIPAEDVEARFLIPREWTPESDAKILLIIRHENYVIVNGYVKGDLGYSTLLYTDSYYPTDKKLSIPLFVKVHRDAKEAYQQILAILLRMLYPSQSSVARATSRYRNNGFFKERDSAFADLTMDFVIMGPILEYCEDALEAFKNVTMKTDSLRLSKKQETEVSADGGGNSSPDPDSVGDTAGTGDADQDRLKDQEE